MLSALHAPSAAWWPWLAMLLGATACAMAAAGDDAVGDDAVGDDAAGDDAAGLNDARWRVAVAAALACAAVAAAVWIFAVAMRLELLAHASAETKQAMMRGWFQAAQLRHPLTLAPAAFALAAGVIAAGGARPRSTPGRLAAALALVIAASAAPAVALERAPDFTRLALAEDVQLRRSIEARGLSPAASSAHMFYVWGPLVVIERGAVSVDGERALALEGGRIPAAAMDDGRIAPLRDRLQTYAAVIAAAQGGGSAPLRGELRLLVDARVSCGVVEAVRETASRVGFSAHSLLVATGVDNLTAIVVSASPRWAPDPLPPLPATSPYGVNQEIPDRFVELLLEEPERPAPRDLELVVYAAAPPRLQVGEGAPEAVADVEELVARLSAIKDEYPDVESASVRPDPTLPFGALVAILDATRGSYERPLFRYVTMGPAQ